MKLYDREPAAEEAWIVQHVGYSCNSACPFCIIQYKREWPQPSTGELLADMETLPERVGRHYFTGGEPTMRRDLPILAERAHRRTGDVWLQTNGRQFSDTAYVERMEGLVQGAIVSFHAADEEHSRTLTGRPGAFHETVEGVRNLLDAGVMVETNTVITRYNIDRLEDVIACIERELAGVAKVRLAYAAFNPANPAGHFVSLTTARGAIEAILRRRGRGAIEVENVPLCIVDLEAAGANFTDGRRLKALVGGRLVPIRGQRTYVETCEGCSVSGRCQGLYVHYTAFFRPETEVRAIL